MAGRLRCHMRGRSFHLNVWGLVVPVATFGKKRLTFFYIYS